MLLGLNRGWKRSSWAFYGFQCAMMNNCFGLLFSLILEIQTSSRITFSFGLTKFQGKFVNILEIDNCKWITMTTKAT